ncbi:uncharacterized protein LOC142231296 [Haematobia irritans]|uniref:uncharacterized protein LOC142231296 n=1 Tax=Haematobia irritans TaxID=7368 RepID=UPI003F4FA9A8
MSNNGDEHKGQSCGKCTNADDDRMVMCDHCDIWYHFECVGVDSGVADREWNCEKCDQPNPSKSTNKTIPLPLSSSSPKTPTTIHVSPPLTTIVSSMPHIFVPKPTCTPMLNGIPSNAITTNITNLGPVNYLTAAQQMGPPTHTQTYTLPVSQRQNNPAGIHIATTTTTTFSHSDTQRLRNLQIEREEEERRLKHYLDEKYEMLARADHGRQATSRHEPGQVYGLNSSNRTEIQIAARHVLPKDLPAFSGDPDDWPLFISTFQNSTEIGGFTNAENLIRLQSCLKGKAKEIVKSKLLLPQLVPEIIETLRMCFGRPEHILERAINKARSMPSPKDKLESLIDFALSVKNIVATIESCEMQVYLNNPMIVKELVEKLPSHYKLNWAMQQQKPDEPILTSFSNWLYVMAEAASKVVTPSFGKTASSNTHTQASFNDAQKGKLCVSCQSEGHKITNCEHFKVMQLNQKWDLVKTNNLCRTCLVPHRRKCYLNKECGVQGCKAKHHPLLHKSGPRQIHQTSDIQHVEQINSHYNNCTDGPLFRIIPVKLHSNGKTLNTFAFLDEGSSVTLMDRYIYDMMDMTGVRDPLCLQWTGNTTRCEQNSMVCSMKISGVHNNVTYDLSDVHTVDDLELPMQTINFEQLSKKYKYLVGLPIKSYEAAKPMILIGSNNWKLAIPLKIREGDWDQPIAAKTRLGWSIQGGKSSSKAIQNLNIHTCECEKLYEELHALVKAQYNIDSTPEKNIMSKNDQIAISVLSQKCKYTARRYEAGLIWQNDAISLPPSYDNALKRHKCLARKMTKDTDLYTAMQDQIKNLIQKGYAKKLTDDEIKLNNGKIWYLPIFIARNPNKPKKLRLVWDAASKSNGYALNDFLLAGPDLLQPLTKILLQFRMGIVAICGDIAEMFHRININTDDAQAQRFLWADENDDIEKPSVYMMNALTFGVKCAPFIAHFVRDHNADKFSARYPRAVDCIKNNHYVDDMIDCGESEEEVANLAKQVSEIHASGGFQIRNWISNSPKVVEILNGNGSPPNAKKVWGDTEKVLGMYWDSTNDVFKYICSFARLRRNVFEKTAVPTKRECLQVLMSVFDPLGLVSCHTIGLKLLLQEIWRSGIGWDESIPDELREKWTKWVFTIPTIESVEIPRCYSIHINKTSDIQLHIFVDAGEFAYGAVCYLLVRYNDEISVSLVAAKSKVAPVKPVSIPRLELQAALVGVRLAKTIKEIDRIRIRSEVYWSDSKTVLNWLKMDPRRFQQFVMYRVGEILEYTDVPQWRWIPSKNNPADLVTKPTNSKNSDMWFLGPTFLRRPENEWPSCSDLGKPEMTEVRARFLNIHTRKSIEVPMNLQYFSSWKRLYRAVARFLWYMRKLKCAYVKKSTHSDITTEIISQAQSFLIRQAQFSEFFDEIHCLKSGKNIERSSKLIPFNVYLAENDVLKTRGRTEYLSNHEDAIVLPTNHHITFLIVRSIHEKYHHMMHEAIINQVKCYYYIPKLRTLYKKVRNSCQVCKNSSANPCCPQMAPLPVARLGSFERPFTYVGIDYFGPLHVTVVRRSEKRWGVLFTCLSLRAVHIEIAHSLDTSSCVMCISNFIARRGMPREIYTDNGTNFRACERVLATDVRNIDTSQYMAKFDKVIWKFNPQAAPHMGGAWERMVRSVKNALYTIYPSQKFNDETLKSAMCEIESIVNSRPLTFVSIDSEDDEAITPNHLLLGSSDGYKPILQNNMDLRQRWHHTQLFADRFWQRWLAEYIPIITKRGKWFAKQKPIAVGDIVIIVDDTLPRRCWPKGRITNVIVAKDGQARRVTVQTQTGTLDRPVAKIAVLDVFKKEEAHDA